MCDPHFQIWKHIGDYIVYIQGFLLAFPFHFVVIPLPQAPSLFSFFSQTQKLTLICYSQWGQGVTTPGIGEYLGWQQPRLILSREQLENKSKGQNSCQKQRTQSFVKVGTSSKIIALGCHNHIYVYTHKTHIDRKMKFYMESNTKARKWPSFHPIFLEWKLVSLWRIL
jgi:hypothetical protein